MIVAGIGCRKGASGVEIDAAIDAALAQAGYARTQLGAIATSDGKGSEGGIIEAAAGRGLRIVLVKPAELEAAGPRTQSSSPRVKELFGVPSVAEAAALAACGPKARLVLPRIVVGPATCAIATDDAP
ncbi:MAG: cobalamin biosynthesis protein [Methyloceanibacter sp.]|uniref:cobalamin biosynthesis protein n=1 Tax=Methyloceanibacter sp. TaxID=1965321 RepID=UPI003D6CFF32